MSAHLFDGGEVTLHLSAVVAARDAYVSPVSRTC